MKISKHLHSCIVLEKEGTRALLDPGKFSFIEGRLKPEYFKDISAVFITHNHGDHCDLAALKTIIRSNPAVTVFTNPSTHIVLKEAGIAAELFHEGQKTIGAFSVRAIPAEHERVSGIIPDNTAYYFDETFIHPGDSLNPALYSLSPKVLAFPTFAPWGNDGMFEQFLDQMKPKIVIPIHDGYIKEFFFSRKYDSWKLYCKERGADFRALELGETLEI